jgi:glycosyltransferase involved in cell wall biosynthesis
MALITVLTTFRNASRFLEETVASIQAQTIEDWEYILVDDASTDGSGEIARRLADRDDRLRVIHSPVAGGPYAAANLGLAHAAGRYVARTDADDVSLPQRFDRQVLFLRENPGLRACGAFVRVIGDGAIAPIGADGLPRSQRTLKWRLCVRPVLAHSTAFIERDALREIGGYQELPTSQDYRMWCHLARREWLGVVPEVLVHWRAHEGQLTHTSSTLQEHLRREVLRDHLLALTDECWEDRELDLLRWVGIQSVPFGAGLVTISKFGRAWRGDSGLTRDDVGELKRLTLGMLGAHLRAALVVWLERLGMGGIARRMRTLMRSRAYD